MSVSNSFATKNTTKLDMQEKFNKIASETSFADLNAQEITLVDLDMTFNEGSPSTPSSSSPPAASSLDPMSDFKKKEESDEKKDERNLESIIHRFNLIKQRTMQKSTELAQQEAAEKAQKEAKIANLMKIKNQQAPAESQENLFQSPEDQVQNVVMQLSKALQGVNLNVIQMNEGIAKNQGNNSVIPPIFVVAVPSDSSSSKNLNDSLSLSEIVSSAAAASATPLKVNPRRSVTFGTPTPNLSKPRASVAPTFATSQQTPSSSSILRRCPEVSINEPKPLIKSATFDKLPTVSRTTIRKPASSASAPLKATVPMKAIVKPTTTSVIPSTAMPAKTPVKKRPSMLMTPGKSLTPNKRLSTSALPVTPRPTAQTKTAPVSLSNRKSLLPPSTKSSLLARPSSAFRKN